MIIAVDGPTASGKGTIASAIASPGIASGSVIISSTMRASRPPRACSA